MSREEYDKRIAKRQEMNRALVRYLAALVEAHPTERFGQLLRNHDFIKEDKLGAWLNEFYLESYGLLERVKDSTAK